jgi:hypothetical protein
VVVFVNVHERIFMTTTTATAISTTSNKSSNKEAKRFFIDPLFINLQLKERRNKNKPPIPPALFDLF